MTFCVDYQDTAFILPNKGPLHIKEGTPCSQQVLVISRVLGAVLFPFHLFIVNHPTLMFSRNFYSAF